MNNSEFYKNAKNHEHRGEIEKAYQYYLEAVLSEDDGEAMYALARMYFAGDYVDESYDKAGRYFGMAYDREANIEPWTLIIAGGYWEQRKDESNRNLLLAVKYYQAAADRGIAFGYECLGKLYTELGEYDKAYENLRKTDSCNPCGFYYLGKLYEEGLGVGQNIEKALCYYKKAVECGLKFKEQYGEDDYSAKARKRLSELEVETGA